ncbi:hypothetical protein KW805_00530 [Candidatus Pacearchaeota archaeon]|nr:hypothetical protein [Candidatus Pacearchaeota archaeon]
MADRSVEIEYINGKRETIDLSLVIQYAMAPNYHFYGCGCEMDYIAQSLQERKSILISRKFGEDFVERAINANNILDVRNLKGKDL